MRKLVPALAAAVVAVAGFGAPAMAADADGPAVQWASSIEDDLGRIQVSASSAAGVTGLTAHIIAPATKTEVAAVTSFHLTSGTAESGVWQSDEVLLPNLGYYTLNVEATDAAGGHTEADGIGNFTYAVKMYIDDLKTTPTVTYTQRTYQVSGKLMGRWPGTGATAPVPGVPVYALIPDGDFADTTSGDKGQFSLSGPVTDPDSGVGYVSTSSEPTYYLQAYSDLPVAKIKQSPTKVTMHLDRNSIVSEDPVTVSGDASWKSPTGWVPMANASIAIGTCPYADEDPKSCFSGPTTTTDANGHYSYVLNPYLAAVVSVAVDSNDMYVQSVAYASAKITVLMPTSFVGFGAGRDPDTGQVYVGAQGLEQTGFSPVDTVVSVQFSKNGVTGWHTIDTIDLGENAGSSFSQSYDHPGAGYWRLTYAGDKGYLEPTQTDPAYVA